MSDTELTVIFAAVVAVACAFMVVFAPGAAALYAVAFGATLILCALQWLRWRTLP